MFNLTKLALLWDWIGDLKKNVAALTMEVGPNGENLLPSRSTATTGQILKLTGENKTPSWADEYSYTPPAYSTTETATGQKWIDGKDVYCKVFSGTFPVISSTSNQNIGTLEADTLISANITLKIPSALYHISNQVINYKGNKNLDIISVPTSYSETDYFCIVYYTKSDPVPGRAPEDPEEIPEESKKVTKKKTTK